MARKNWITALACCALLALGACTHSDSDDEKVSSGGGPPPAERSVADATQALTDAKQAVTKAATAFDEADLAVADAQTREAVKAATQALNAAVEAADAAVKAAGDDADARAEAEVAKKAVDDYRAENPLNLAILTVAVWDAEDAVTGGGEALETARAALAKAVAALDEAVAALPDGDRKTALTKVADDAAPVPAVGSVAAAETALTDAKEAVKAAETALNEAVITASVTPVAVSQADDDSAASAPKTPKAKAREALEVAKKALNAAVEAADAAVKAAGDDAAAKKLADAAKEAVDEYRAEKPLELVTLTVAVWDAADAVTAAGDDATAAQKTALKAAQEDLDEAVEELDDGALKTALSKVADEADELRKSLAWATGAGLEPGVPSSPKMGEVTVTPHSRIKPADAGSSWKRLAIRAEAVSYDPDKFVISPDGDGTTDELPLRAVTVRQFDFIQGEDDGKNGPSNTRGELKSSIELTEDGLTLKVGGEAIWNDMQKRFDIGEAVWSWFDQGKDGIEGDKDRDVSTSTDLTGDYAAELVAGGDLEGAAFSDSKSRTLTEKEKVALNGYDEDNGTWVKWDEDDNKHLADWNNDDLTIAFGKPSQAPDGSAAWYWRARVPFHGDQTFDGVKAYEGVTLSKKANQDLGQYELWLSNYGGFHKNVEVKVLGDATDAQKETLKKFNEADNEHRHLSHAAYGLFQYLDNVAYTTEFSRSQAFHFGYDAFKDTSKKSELAKPIKGTFVGHTMAHVLLSKESNQRPSDRLETLRGSIRLETSIGGDNEITGNIENFERYGASGWGGYADLHRVTLTDGTITSDGSYKGTATAQNAGDEDQGKVGGGFGAGTFSGSFYGPVGKDLETAGWWEVSDQNGTKASQNRIIGSYGAVCTKGCGDD